jgi:hypothetical protein
MLQRISRDELISEEDLLTSLKACNPQGFAGIPQWHIRVDRLDAQFRSPDGALTPAYRYGGYDLVKWEQRKKAFRPLQAGNNKENYISSAWKRVAGTIEPPTSLTGKMFMFDFWPAKRIGGSMPAKNVLEPTQILPPTFVYTGEVQIIEVRSTDGVGTESVPEPPLQQGGAPITEADALDLLVTKVLPGTNLHNAAGIIASLPPELRTGALLSGIASGTLLETLAKEGRISVAADGTISVL